MDNTREERPEYSYSNSDEIVFLLSYDDVVNTDYGFKSDNSAADPARAAKGTDYSKCQGLMVTESQDGRSGWWLRTSGNTSSQACYVGSSMESWPTWGTGCTNCGVRPAITLDLSDLNVQCNYVETIEKKASCTEDGIKSYGCRNIYWFKYEPIEWRVLDPSTGLVLSNMIVDTKAFSNYAVYNDAYGEAFRCFGNPEQTYYENNYENSYIRQWLNDDFNSTAFTTNEQEQIETTLLNNDGFWTAANCQGYEAFDGNQISDKVFLLSFSDALNTDYGYDSSQHTNDTARLASGTDYAKCQGLRVIGNDVSGWRLRSAGDTSSTTCYVGANGTVYPTWGANATACGVRPALSLTSARGHNKDDIILFGEYPQSEVKNGDITSELQTLSVSSEWISYEYYTGTGAVADGNMTPGDFCRYTDVELNGERYRGVTFDSYIPSSTGFAASSEAYVASPSDGSKNPCTFQAINGYICNCGNSYTETIPARNHRWSEWYILLTKTNTMLSIQIRLLLSWKYLKDI